MEQLAEEIRGLIVETVSHTGGHLAANLGVVELTISLLKCFNPPDDKIIWDVSHQTYAYKILTGRKSRFGTLRQYGGISGFLRRDESPYDCFGAGHSGTALSAALGMAVARDLRGSKEHVIAVVGDGSAGCGISFEALNNVDTATGRLIVVLNDNEMSIAANVGSMSRYFGGLLANPRYNRWKGSVESMASRLKMDFFRSAYYRIEEAVKSLFLRSVIFEEFGLRYIGPIDGHNIPALLNALVIARDSPKPILLHVATQKGRGYAFAERSPEKWHSTDSFDVASGKPLVVRDRQTYSQIFGAALERFAERDKRIVAITAAMRAGTGLTRFAERFPDRFFDVGISEEHATVFAAGLAAEGLIPVLAVYSTFSQRAVDCIIHDVCLQRLPVIMCLDRAGIVGDDGPTHHGIFDIALLRPAPGLVMMQPKDEAELVDMLFTAISIEKPVVIRYPRGGGSGAAISGEGQEMEVGKSEVVRGGGAVQIWGLGDMVAVGEAASDLLKLRGIDAGVVNARFVRPMDTALLKSQAEAAHVIVTIENGVLDGGFGSAVEAFLGEIGFVGRILKFGWLDQFIPHGRTETLMRAFGLTPESIAERVQRASSEI